MRRWIPLLGPFLFAIVPSTASAHFFVDYPDAGLHSGPSPIPWWNQDGLGSPQKLGPCGDEDDATDAGGGPTYVVTPFAAGQTITLQWSETISHAGWFRIAIAADRATFQDPPIEVAPNGNSADAGIENPPVLPVLADGIYPHALGAAKTWPPYSLTLPSTPCAKCTIQIIQIMLDHPSNLGNLPDGAPNPDGFLYHHCIDISILAPDGGSNGGGPDGGSGGEAGTPDSGGTVGAPDGGSPIGMPDSGGGPTGPGSDSGPSDAGSTSSNVGAASGCGCSAAAGGALTGNALALLGIAILVRRRAHRRARGDVRTR